MAKIQPSGMKTNFKTRLNYTLTGIKDVPKCLTRHTLCINYPDKCEDCMRIQGIYTEFKEKK